VVDSFQERPYFDADTQDLVNELMTRGSAVIVLMARPMPSATSEHKLQVFKQLSGGEIEVKGLIAHIQDHVRLTDFAELINKMGDQFNDPEPGDPT